MNPILRQILPYLLRPFESLSESDVSLIITAYQQLGRDSVERELRREKQTRCYASLVLSKIDCDSVYWTNVHSDYVKRNIAILDIVKKCSTDFKLAGGKTLSVYENYGAVLSSGISIGCFASGDVDFTVCDSELTLAREVFEKNGFTLDCRMDHASVSNKLVLPFYNQNALGNGYWLNIMRKPIARKLFLNQTAYLDRLHNLQINYLEYYKDTDVQLLKPTAMVYFNALHFACEHYYSASPGMALCCDIDRIVRSRDIDWEELKKWSLEDKAGLRIQLALDICKYFLQTPIPFDLFDIQSDNYKHLWNKVVDEQNFFLVPQISRFERSVIELLSDDKSITYSAISRVLKLG